MEDIVSVLDDIKAKLVQNRYENEQHVRISLVTRICKSLGWNVWDPQEYYTEYNVPMTAADLEADPNKGKVDVTLLLPGKDSDKPQVHFEVKACRVLQTSLTSSQTQIFRYCNYKSPKIGILTNGIKWQFFMPSQGGDFLERMFNDIDLLKNTKDELAELFRLVLARSLYPSKIKKTAESMLKEYSIIYKIQAVKNDAIIETNNTGDKYIKAVELIKERFNVTIRLDVVIKKWETTIAFGSKGKTPPPPPPPSKSIKVYLSVKGIKASGICFLDSGRFILHKNSEITKHFKPGMSASYAQYRKTMEQEGKITLSPDKSKFILQEDLSFKKPSGASGFVLGRNSNGYAEWADKDGKKLEKYF